ncbi:MAG: hypothetical protein JF586_14405 [Burkholderiales bacterium]|nr:hypothetical protein [Burkholderiales bacterium]
MSIEPSLPAWHRHAIVPLAVAGGISLAMLPGVSGALLGLLLLGASLSALLSDRLRHHVRMQAQFCERWSGGVTSPQAAPAVTPPRPSRPAADARQRDRRRRGVAAKAAALRLAMAGGEEPAELELQVRGLMDALSRHVRRETDLLGRQANARRRADVDAARLQLANAEYDFHRYCIGELTLPELVDRVSTALIPDPAPTSPCDLTGHDPATSRLGKVDV